MGGFLTGLVQGLGNKLQEENLLEMEKQNQQRKNLLDTLKYMMDAPPTMIRPEARTMATEMYMEAVRTKPGKKLPKSISLDRLMEIPAVDEQTPPIPPQTGSTVQPNTAEQQIAGQGMGSIQPQTIPSPPRPITPMSPYYSMGEREAMATRQKQTELDMTTAAHIKQSMATERARAALKAPPRPTVITTPPGATSRMVDAQGNVISEFSGPPKPEGAGQPLDRELADLYEKVNNGTATPADRARIKAIEKSRTLASQTNYNFQNPPTKPDDVKWIADQVERDFTVYPALVGSNKNLKNAVNAELASRGTNVNKITSATRQLGETSKTLLPKFQHVIDRISSPEMAAKMGPIAGRWQEFLAGKVGKGDPDFSWLRTQLGLLQTGLMRAHVGARGGQLLLGHFQELINSDYMDAATLRAGLGSAMEFLQGYVDAVYGTQGAAKVEPPPKSDEGVIELVKDPKTGKLVPKGK